VAVAEALREVDGHDPSGGLLDAAHLALSARVAVDETTDTTPEQIITELWKGVSGTQKGS